MEQLLKQNEIEKIQSTLKTHPLLLTCYKVFTPRMARLNGLQVSQEDIFYETTQLLDFLLSKPEINQHQVDSLWIMLLNNIRKWKVDASNHDKQIVANTVFQFARATLAQHAESHYSESVCDMLKHTIERNQDGLDEQEYEEFLQRLIDKSPELSEWINQYDEEDEWLSDKIAETIASTYEKEDNKSKKPKRKNDSKPEKQHGVEYPVFTKGQGVTDDHIKALYSFLTTRGWISTQTSVVDFQRLFSGESNNCEIIWMGMDKLGNNEPTILGVSALYILFKRMADEKLISIGNNSNRIGPILETHFVDTEGHFLTSVSNVKKTSIIAEDYIEKILKMMKTRMSSDDIQHFLAEEMESKYDKNDLQDLRYHKPH